LGEWEQEHRSQRLSRRRELRRIEAARIAAQPETLGAHHGEVGILLPLVAGCALAAYNPKLVIGASGMTLVVAAAYKKDWHWWIVGVLL
jgi:hypothetical protein